MDPRFKELVTRLEESGWESVDPSIEALDWWADEIWEFRSRWSPSQKRLFLTLIVDPMWEGDRKPGQGVWAIGSSAVPPVERVDASSNALLPLKSFSTELASFLGKVERIRAERTGSGNP